MSHDTQRPWISDRAFISPWTYEANQSIELAKRVTVYDVTLRDGEQYPGLVFTEDDKVRLADTLDWLGINRLEAGMPAVSRDDFEAGQSQCSGFLPRPAKRRRLGG